MGGTFDPIHNGHLVTSEEARCQFGLEKVIFIPSARPPHKREVKQSPFEDRYRMVELAVEGNVFLSVSLLEMERSGLSYTIDTLHELRLCLLYTSDAADDLLCVDLGGRRIIKKK